MAINDFDILIDVKTGRLMRDITSDVQIQPRPLVQGDTYNVRVMALQARPGRPIDRVFDFVELPAAIYVGLGDVGERPQSGVWTLTFDGDTTAALAYNATPAAVETALNALASITAAGGVTVSGEAGGPYQIAFADVGAQTALAATTGGLYPPTSATVYEARVGDASTAEIQIVALDRQSAALATTFTDLPAAAGTVEEIIAGNAGTGQLEMQRVSISADAYDGTFSLSFGAASTVALPYNIEAADLQAALETAGTFGTGVVVTGAFPVWDITFGGTAADKALITIDVTGLKVPIGKQGELALTTAGIEAIVAGQESATTKLEVTTVNSGKHSTILQVNATVLNDGIQNAPETGPTLPEYYTASEVDALLADISATSSVYAVASSDQNFAGDDGVPGSMTDDDTLFFTAESNSVYEITFHTRFESNYTPASTLEHSAEWSLPASATIHGTWQAAFIDTGAYPEIHIVGQTQSASDIGSVFVANDSGVLGAVTNTALLVTGATSGTAKLRFQCNFETSSADVITRKAGSFLVAKKLN